jgi:hypothetical protein
MNSPRLHCSEAYEGLMKPELQVIGVVLSLGEGTENAGN